MSGSHIFAVIIVTFQMKNNQLQPYYFIITLSLFWLFAGCKKESGHAILPSDPNYIPKGNLADMAYNPVRQDGSIDSSYLPIMKWEEDVYDFGTIKEGEVVEKKYRFKNVGTAPLVVLNATSTCGCTIPEWPKNHILPDSIGIVTVRFNSKNKEGAQNKEVTIFANTLPNHSKINIKGTVVKSK